MKTLLAFAASTGLALAQGPLAPSAGPAPTMKTLAQIEARTAIPASPATPVAGPHFTISVPGSYYLTGNITVTSGDGIRINASNVTLDLNGFSLISTSVPNPVSGNAIEISGQHSSIEIKNGRIVGGTIRTYLGPNPWNASFSSAGWDRGISSTSANADGLLLSGLSIEKCAGSGIYVVSGGTLQRITATSNGGTGIHAVQASVVNSIANKNGNIGIYAPEGSVSDSAATSNSTSGIFAAEGSVTNSTASNNGFYGIAAEEGNVTGCTANRNGWSGIYATRGSVAHSTANLNTYHGMDAFPGSVTSCTANSNNWNGLNVGIGSVTDSSAYNNAWDGISAFQSSVSNCRAIGNGNDGIEVDFGVVAHCVASGNNPDAVATDFQIKVIAGGQRIGNVPAIEAGSP